MPKKLLLKSLLVLMTCIVFISLIFCIYSVHKLYNSIFRLSANQVLVSLSEKTSPCQKISDCKLLPGDILIRRYVTSKTWSFNQFARPYFTHSAFYLGDNQIVEAIGTEKNHQNEIQISKLSESDWWDGGIESFVIVRPKYTSEKLNQIKINLTDIANDPNYKFGLPQTGVKQTTCADLILEQLIYEKVVTVSSTPKIITPDYLFWLTINNPNDFEIIGFNIK